MDRFQIAKVDGESENSKASPANTNSGGITLKGFNLLSRKFSRKENHDRKLSLAQLTKETLPRLDNYRASRRHLKRPSIGELHGEPVIDEPDKQKSTEVILPSSGHEAIKLGWIVGVVIPCLLNIWGVMLFLRLSWVVAQSGIIQTMIIITISAAVCIITTLSLSAISTNGEVKGGGVYFIISRSLGPEFGASVGVVFAFANAVAASMNTIGFCDSLNDLLGSHGLKIVDGGINDVRIIGTVAILVMILICCVGMEWETKAQNFLIASIVIAIIDFIIGAIIGPRGDDKAVAKGFVGFSIDTFGKNLGSDYRFSEGVNQNFFSVFAIFFPSVTGIQAGANISGDLKDPSKSIPKGTLLALLISMVSYATFVIFAGGAALRDASGDVAELINGTIPEKFACQLNDTCTYGLHNSYSVMQLMSVWGPIIYLGCFAACLSTALTNLLSVPRLIQALGIDQIYPGLIFFSKPYGKHGEPYRGYVLTFFISVSFLLIGQLNVIAPLISNFYLASYALINFCTFHAAFVKPLGWRPTFRYYNAWLSLAGFCMCVAIMFLIDWISSIVTFAIIFALYLVVVYRKPDVNWGSSAQAQTYKTAIAAVHKLQAVSEHVKNYQPQILVLSGDPKTRPALVDLGNLITKHSSLLVVGRIVPMKVGYKTRMAMLSDGQKYLAAKKIKAFYNIIDGMPMEDGVNALIKASGYGRMKPNIILMGYKADWQTCHKEDAVNYFNVLENAFSLRMGVAILRVRDGLDFSELSHEINTPCNGNGNGNGNGYSAHQLQGISNPAFSQPSGTTSELLHVDSNLNLATMMVSSQSQGNLLGIHSSSSSLTTSPGQPTSLPVASVQKPNAVLNHTDSVVYSTKGSVELPKSVLDAVTIFTRKQTKGTIDIWWLYDDGGLTVLLPYIISMRTSWEKCKLRVFALTNRRQELELEERNLASLLKKFRINYSELIMLQGVYDTPRPETIQRHERLLDGFRTEAPTEGYVSEAELRSLEEKTHRQLRLHELVKQHSSEANLIVMSLPMPRKDSISAPLYLSWLEMLTCDIACPFILARGNQTPVLTFYS